MSTPPGGSAASAVSGSRRTSTTVADNPRCSPFRRTLWYCFYMICDAAEGLRLVSDQVLASPSPVAERSPPLIGGQTLPEWPVSVQLSS
jgi:hypothetical protein